MKSQVSFWQLLADYVVKIPMIQRDYAQGRTDARTQYIRTSFLTNLRDALVDERGHLNLDFVYGSDRSGSLILLDGQQRLTTLFLLHWYLAVSCTQFAEHAATRLSKFTYETRTTTRDFCGFLVAHLRGGAISWGEKLPSEWIEDASWFPRSWLRDPSIAGMLIMLDAIHKHFNSTNKAELWTRLTDEIVPAITFQFLNMEKFRLTDELYIKMNARGKALSDFENFKAWLQTYVERNRYALLPADWTDALDCRWLDLFWRHREPGMGEVDDAYLNFFNGQALCTFAASRIISKGDISDSDAHLIRALNENKYFGGAEREEQGAYTPESLSRSFTILEALCQSKIAQDSYFKRFTQPRNYGERVLAYAIGAYLERARTCDPAPVLESIEFQQWIRVLGNLVMNTTIDTPIAFVRAIKSINSLTHLLLSAADVSEPLYVRLARRNPSKIEFFAEAQCEEEVRKCQLIAEAQDWEDIFIAVESHSYFAGQIGFLIDLSSTMGKPDQVSFKRYAELASLLFGADIRNDGRNLLQRALLSYGDYTVAVGSNVNLCRSAANVLRDREENWRRVFRDSARALLLKQLCDDLAAQLAGITATSVNLVERLRQIVETKVPPYPPDDWRSLLIKTEHILDKCAYLQLRRAYNAATGHTSTYVLAGLRMSGSHAEISTLALSLRLAEKIHQGELVPFTECGYRWVSGGENEPYLFLRGWHIDGREAVIRIRNEGGEFVVQIGAVQEGIGMPLAILQQLVTSLAFSLTQNGRCAVSVPVPPADIEKRIDEIVEILQQHARTADESKSFCEGPANTQ